MICNLISVILPLVCEISILSRSDRMVDSSFKCNFEKVPSLQRSEMFIAPTALMNPRSVRSETYGELANQPKHCAPPERGTNGGALHYEHLAPLERKQLMVLHSKLNSRTINGK